MKEVCFGSHPKTLPRKNVKSLVKGTDGICGLLRAGSVWAVPQRGRQVPAVAWRWGTSQRVAGTRRVLSTCCFLGGTWRCPQLLSWCVP